MFALRSLLLAAVALLLALALAAAPARAGLPNVSDLQQCQTYLQSLSQGQVSPEICRPDTLATIKRCIAQGVQFGAFTQAQADQSIVYLDAYCATQG